MPEQQVSAQPASPLPTAPVTDPDPRMQPLRPRQAETEPPTRTEAAPPAPDKPRRQPLQPRETETSFELADAPRLGDAPEVDKKATPVTGDSRASAQGTPGPVDAEPDPEAETAAPETLRRGLFGFDFFGDDGSEDTPAKVELREPRGLSDRYSDFADEVASEDYTATLGSSNPTPDEAPLPDAFDVAEVASPYYDARGDANTGAYRVTPGAPEVLEPPQAIDTERMIESAIPPTFEGDSDYAIDPGEAADYGDDPYGYAEPNLAVARQPYAEIPDSAYSAVATPQIAAPAMPAALPTTGPVTVALLTPQSDSRAQIRKAAENLAKAAALAAEEIGNRQLVLRAYDTKGTPAGAAEAARKAVGDGARLILGPLFSGSVAAVAPVAQGAGISVIAFTTDTAVLRRGLYSIGYLPETEVDRMLAFAKRRGLTRIAAMAPDTAYGGTVYQALQSHAPGHGISIERVQPIQSDFSTMDATSQEFATWYAANPELDGILFATGGKPLQALAAYLAYRDVLPSKVKYMGLGIWDDPETFREATLRDGWFPGLDPTLRAEFEGRYEAKHGSEPLPIAALGYDGVAVAAALLDARATSNGYGLGATAIERPSGFTGMSGLFRFLSNGRNQRALAILKVGRRQFDLLDPAPKTFDDRVSRLDSFGQ